jgi:hypothetical protein
MSIKLGLLALSLAFMGVLFEHCGRVTDDKIYIQDDMVMTEGDIILAEPGRGQALPKLTPGGRWPRAVIPYVIDSKLPNPSRVTEAIRHFQSLTKLRFVPRTTQAGYVIFRPWTQGYCRSWIGYRGIAQAVDLDIVCDTRSVIHELGHTAGMWHEHTRRDRYKYVKVHLENVAPSLQSNFLVQTLNAELIGPYDFSSVMHYRPFELSMNGKPTLTKLDGTIEGLSNPNGLSQGDIAALRYMYP